MKAPTTVPMAFDLSDVSVMLAIPVNRDLPWQTAQSLVETVIALKDKGIAFEVQFLVGSSIIEVARSKVADAFLKSSCNRLFMLDSDQAWQAKDVLRLLALSTKMLIVLGAYPAKRDPPTFLMAPEDEMASNEWGCIPVNGFGLGFTLVCREVIEALAKDAPLLRLDDSGKVTPHIFRCDSVDGVFRGEDMAFFADTKAHGYQAWLDPSLEISHIGAKAYRGRLMDALISV